jgi:multiple sugar transport system substrate-binding protein
MRTPAKILTAVLLALLFGLSLRQPSSAAGSLSVLMEPDGTGVWRELFGEFARVNPGIDVEFVEGPPATNAREDMYSTAFLSGRGGFDLVYCDVIWVPRFAAAGWLMDLTGRVPPADLEDFFPGDVLGGSYQGRLYRIPALTDAGLLYYRRDLMTGAPETFADLLEASRREQTGERWGFVWQGRQYEGLVTFFLEVLWGHGGDWIDAQTLSVHLDEPAAAEALQFMVDLVGGISPPGVTTYAEEETRIIFQNSRSVFLRNWLYVWGLLDVANGISRDQVGLALMPHVQGEESAAVLGGWGFAISRFTDNPDAAWQLVEFLTQPASLAKVRDRLGRVPARRSLAPPEFAPILLNARPRPAIPQYAQASDILQRWLSAALTRRTTAAEALREAAAETRRLLAASLAN